MRFLSISLQFDKFRREKEREVRDLSEENDSLKREVYELRKKLYFLETEKVCRIALPSATNGVEPRSLFYSLLTLGLFPCPCRKKHKRPREPPIPPAMAQHQWTLAFKPRRS